MQKKPYISMSVIRRLPRYYRFLKDLDRRGILRVSSRELSEKLGLTASQVRQDFNCFGGYGQQGYGYAVRQLREEIGNILGLDRAHKCISFCTDEKPVMAILCIPRAAVESAVDKLYALGIRNYWNFSSYDIALHHKDAVVETVHLSDSMMTLCYRVSEQQAKS